MCTFIFILIYSYIYLYSYIYIGAAGLYLLGIICRKEQRLEAAIEYFQRSLEVDSAMWGSIKELSEMGISGIIFGPFLYMI
jgi:tetratricopeptide (TPR) repeat protein